MKSVFIVASVLLAFVEVSTESMFGGKDTPLKWNTLRTTWGILPIEGKFYDTMPLKSKDADKIGWKNLSLSCTNGDKFSGYRYVLGEDTSISLLYNANGIISGIQMNPKVDDLKKNNNDYKFDQVSMFQKNTIGNDEVYTLTAYFTDPSTICDTQLARTVQDLNNGGIGDQLYFQDGEGSTTNYKAPKNRQNALSSGWNNNHCFPGMGWHTWYKSEQLAETNCTMDRPVFLLFNKQQELLGFGFNVVGNAESESNRYEHPPILAVKTIMGNPPQCLIDRQKTVGLTTMHVFFVDYSAIPKLDCINPF